MPTILLYIYIYLISTILYPQSQCWQDETLILYSKNWNRIEAVIVKLLAMKASSRQWWGVTVRKADGYGGSVSSGVCAAVRGMDNIIKTKLITI